MREDRCADICLLVFFTKNEKGFNFFLMIHNVFLFGNRQDIFRLSVNNQPVHNPLFLQRLLFSRWKIPLDKLKTFLVVISDSARFRFNNEE